MRLTSLFIKTFTSLLLSLVMILVSCSKPASGWEIDSKYSAYLTVSRADYSQKMSKDVVDTVDELDVYKVNSDAFMSLDKLNKEKPLIKTTEKSVIYRLLGTTNDIEAVLPSCYQARNEYSFHVILKNNTTHKIGYFIVTKCKVNNKVSSMVTHLYDNGESGVFHSEQVERFFDRY